MRIAALALSAALLAAGLPQPARAAGLEAGAASADITPPLGHPMWGYASRRDEPCERVRDPLRARALVLKAGGAKLAFVSLDLGRAPARDSMARVRAALAPLGIDELFLAASHTHHGPVVELDDWPKGGKPYVRELEGKVVAAVRRADAACRPARYGAAAAEVPLNRNRQSKRADAPVDRELLVLRVEGADGKPIAHAVNFAAHPTMLPAAERACSADFVGALAKKVEAATGAPCLFFQGAAGDLSPQLPEGCRTHADFGERLADAALKLSAGIACVGVPGAAIESHREDFRFSCRLDLKNGLVRVALERAFYPELVSFFRKEYADGVRPTLSVAVLDGSVGFVGVSGEFFCEHSLSLKRRARLKHLFFLGYCNDYQQYFPTIGAVAGGGYGTNPPVAAAEIGAGERMVDRALIHLYRLRGKLPELTPPPASVTP